MQIWQYMITQYVTVRQFTEKINYNKEIQVFNNAGNNNMKYLCMLKREDYCIIIYLFPRWPEIMGIKLEF